MCKGSCANLKRDCGTLLGCGGEQFDVSKHCPMTCREGIYSTLIITNTDTYVVQNLEQIIDYLCNNHSR